MAWAVSPKKTFGGEGRGPPLKEGPWPAPWLAPAWARDEAGGGHAHRPVTG